MHPNGYRQMMFQDYTNVFGRGHNALYLHTSPHKQYYIYLYKNIEEWLTIHLDYLLKNKFYIQKNRVSYFLNL